mgnify:CR=1 FL=1
MIIRVEDMTNKIENDVTLIINGDTGDIYIDPSVEEVKKFTNQQRYEQEEKRKLKIN